MSVCLHVGETFAGLVHFWSTYVTETNNLAEYPAPGHFSNVIRKSD